MPPATEPEVRRGRPRSAAADDAIVDAVLQLLGEVGSAGWPMDEVANRAGVSKATIYRRWDSKEALILDALTTYSGHIEPVDTGALRSDLEDYTSTLLTKIREGGPSRGVLPHLVSSAIANPALQAALEQYAEARTRPIRLMLERAVRRGELAGDTDVALGSDLLLGAINQRRLFHRETYDEPTARRLIDYVLRALGATPTQR